jgi:hypothetical protein
MPHASERFASIAGWALDAASGNRDGERSRHQPTSNEVTPDTRSSGTSGGARPACMRAVSNTIAMPARRASATAAHCIPARPTDNGVPAETLARSAWGQPIVARTR